MKKMVLLYVLILLVLGSIHLIVDYMLSDNVRRWHVFLSLNPFHWLIDKWRPHQHHIYQESLFIYQMDESFFAWLGVDQLLHFWSLFVAAAIYWYLFQLLL